MLTHTTITILNIIALMLGLVYGISMLFWITGAIIESTFDFRDYGYKHIKVLPFKLLWDFFRFQLAALSPFTRLICFPFRLVLRRLVHKSFWHDNYWNKWFLCLTGADHIGTYSNIDSFDEFVWGFWG